MNNCPKMKKILLFLMIFSFFYLKVFSEIIVLKSGKTINAKIIEKNNDYIKVNFQGVPIKYYRDEIDRIDRESFQNLAFERKPQKSPLQIFEEFSPATVIIHAHSSSGTSQGSGFVVDKSGVIVTNFHVIGGAEEIEVKFKDGSRHMVSGIVDYDIAKDICLLKIEADNFPEVILGDSNKMTPGEKVFVIGAPLGLEYTITDGLYSGKRKDSAGEVMQFSASISSGNSGGPLFDSAGKVIGITSFVNTEGQSLNFAVPINDVKDCINSYSKISMDDFRQRISKAYSFYSAAYNAYYSGNYQLAINYLKQALELDYNFIEAHVKLMLLYEYTGNLPAAMNQCKEIINIDPSDFAAHLDLGYYYFYATQEYDLAEKEYKKAIELAPEDPIGYSSLAAVYMETDKIDQAFDLTLKALSLEPDYAGAQKNLGWLYYRKGLFNRAIEETKKQFF